MKSGSKSNIVTRLKRAEGHLVSTIKMVEEDCDILNIVHQLHAVLKALERTKQIAVIDYIETQLVDESSSVSDKTKPQLLTLRELTKYL